MRNKSVEVQMPDVYEMIKRERAAAHAKHGPDGGSCEQMSASDNRWLAVLTEEVGEVARALNDHEAHHHLYEELVQVAAMAAAWADAVTRWIDQGTRPLAANRAAPKLSPSHPSLWNAEEIGDYVLEKMHMAAARALNEDGQTCEDHEPMDYKECGPCEDLHNRTAVIVLDAAMSAAGDRI
jgi:NTP pyrophosphatase (non-canonical NTP hydrolase)